MTWALTLEGRSDRGAIVLLIDDRREAERIATEVRSKGIAIVVKPHVSQRTALTAAREPAQSTGTPVG